MCTELVMEELTSLPFYSLTNFEFRNLFESTDDYFGNLLKNCNISEYVLQQIPDDKSFSFRYYSEDKLNSEIQTKDNIELSIFHVNIRSLNHNCHKLILFLGLLNL